MSLNRKRKAMLYRGRVQPDVGTRSVDALIPICKAYGLAYLTSTIPRLPTAVSSIIHSEATLQQKTGLLKAFLTASVGINRLPTSCAIIVGGSTVLPNLLFELLLWLRRATPSALARKCLDVLIKRLTFICAFASAWTAFKLLNEDEGWARKQVRSMTAQIQADHEPPNQHHLPPPGYHTSYAGKTIDFTLFAFCRAVDVLVVSTWMNTRTSFLHPERVAPRTSRILRKLADPWLFSLSSATIMWSWFFAPARLPKSYNQWISKIANIDHRLIQALRLCRQGNLVYGNDETQNADLPSLCKELDLPQKWGNPAITVPIPCELYHCGAGKSCEIHASRRVLTTFTMAMRIYLPLQILSLLRRFSLDKQRILALLRDAARSSSFLAAFVGLFYYSVCLARTRLGPKIFSRKTITPQMWDSGLCVLAGCLACGWSILFEKESRRQEIASFVAPRALATLLPRVYDKRYQRREQLVFAASTALVMDAMYNRRYPIRGMFGKVLESVIR